MPPRTPALILAAAVLTLSGLSGCEGVSLEPAPAPTSTGGSTKDATTSSSELDSLKVVTRAGSMSGYSREKFPHWRSTGSNCDVRDSVLKRDGKNVKTSGCNVVAGSWVSLYDGQKLTSPTKVDIDHMVPLANAWRSGASKWTTAQREDFANDLDDPQLIAVSASSNRSKGDQDPSTWKPTESSSWCEYAQDWIAVKVKWKLTVTTKEKTALKDMLETC
ncbi:HNH endonuclease family protein [Actinoplanes bogorensis]|uniref:HNH endonuclease family protein n=1 Tax=Paractinoplanes bogorensis TaxID=1610840 RepID=A0ABS5YJX9_9ACTN|nr:HNH endonuclease family protein [Actinoplanes bogorensis]MBU2663336.1 HNH endonuclease family protein [Actinoplanes bogorensis]